jgi:hypothetical protein
MVNDKVAISERIGNERHSVSYVVEDRNISPDGTWYYLVRKDGGEGSGNAKWAKEDVLRRR